MPLSIVNNSSERLFAELCAKNYLKGFVFHSPRFGEQFSKEAGDVVLWVRNHIIVFEIIWRNKELGNGNNTKSFVKKIGKKRDQLIIDFEVYGNFKEEIQLINESGEEVSYGRDNFHRENFNGVVLIDSDEDIEPLSYFTVAKSLDADFPIVFITKNDFTDLIAEVDTIPDLTYFLRDRHNFLKIVYPEQSKFFRELNKPIEKNLIAFYKMNDYQFPLEIWEKNKSKNFYDIFIRDFAEKIEQRNTENKISYIVDQLINEIRNINSDENFTILHAAELAIFSRRERAVSFGPKILDAFKKLGPDTPPRYFSFYNTNTACWVLFYFEYSDNSEIFRVNFTEYCQLKLFFEMHCNDFQYSIFGYGFRKTNIDEETSFDEMNLMIEDAKNYPELNIEKLKKAVKLFGHIKMGGLKEFPY